MSEFREFDCSKYGPSASIVTIWFRAFIPNTIHGSMPNAPWFPEPGSIGFETKTDDRGFFSKGTSRVHSFATLLLRDSHATLLNLGSKAGVSVRRYRVLVQLGKAFGGAGVGAALDPFKFVGQNWNDESIGDTEYRTVKKAASLGSATKETVEPVDGTNLTVHLVGEASYPFAGITAPDIDYDVKIFTDVIGAYATFKLVGTHNNFPGYECFVQPDCPKGNLIRVYHYDPAQHGETGPGIVNLNMSSLAISEIVGHDFSRR